MTRVTLSGDSIESVTVLSGLIFHVITFDRSTSENKSEAVAFPNKTQTQPSEVIARHLSNLIEAGDAGTKPARSPPQWRPSERQVPLIKALRAASESETIMISLEEQCGPPIKQTEMDVAEKQRREKMRKRK